jgi:hypothetical protein
MFSIAVSLDLPIVQYSENETIMFRELALLPSSGENAYSVGSDRRG